MDCPIARNQTAMAWFDTRVGIEHAAVASDQEYYKQVSK